MTARIKSFVLAEAAVADARGALTVVGFEPPAWNVASLPSAIPVALIALLDDDLGPDLELEEGTSLRFTPLIVSPAGDTLVAGSGVQALGPIKRNPLGGDSLVRAIVVVSTQLLVDTEGKYSVSLTMSIKDRELRAESEIWVRLNPSVPSS